MDISIEPMNWADIHACAEISRDAFTVDPHTIVKELGRDGYDMYQIGGDDMRRSLERDHHIRVKAVNKATGEIVGHAGWAWPNVDKSLIPRTPPTDSKPAAAAEPKKDDAPKKAEEPPREKDAIDRLHEMEDADMKYWLTELIPQNKPCSIILSLTVSRAHQSQGIGKALIKYGNNIADKLGVSIYVHSSHQAYEAYSKGGFITEKELDVDLDEYAPRPPKDDEEVMGEKGSGKWGHYIIRYMRRDPVKV